jgi:co-chaperonin GroES (HSP10)
MSVEILGDRILIRKTSNDAASAGGIVILKSTMLWPTTQMLVSLLNWTEKIY